MWAGTAIAIHLTLGRARRDADPARELEARRAVAPFLLLEHAALAVSLAAGLALLGFRGWGLGHARWLGLKLGLTAFLLVPLETMHAYICHGWIDPGLRETVEPPFSKDLARGIGMDGMLRALAVPLLGVAVPLLIWLSVTKPF